jgi:hypothetical protein
MKTGLDAAKEHLKYNVTEGARLSQPAIYNLSQALYFVVESLESIEHRLARLDSPPAKDGR